MKRIWKTIGSILFWLLWPFWVIYFHFSHVRARVVVVCDEEVLLLQGWLGSNEFNLPGGGLKKGEKPITAAVRELYEETGITVAESSLTKLGSRKHDAYGIKYHADFFCVTLTEKPELKLRRFEILAAAWVPLEQIGEMKLDTDTHSALRRYRPSEQATLL
jgi:8-oxo-dGTP pyrophosphatase MutT (NUDIX family)